MSRTSDWSPDEPLDTEKFEQRDEAIDEYESLDPDGRSPLAGQLSEESVSMVDERELEEAGFEFDDPEQIATLEGGIDDPDGLGGPARTAELRSRDTEGWELDPDDDDDDVVDE